MNSPNPPLCSGEPSPWAGPPCFFPFDPNLHPRFHASVAGVDTPLPSHWRFGRTFNLLHAWLRKLAHLTEHGFLALLLYGLPE